MRRLIPIAVLALVVAGCGAGAAKPFLPGPTAKCLKSAGYVVSTSDAEVGLVASTAENGGLRVTPKGGGNTLIMAFAADGPDAANVQRSFRRFAPAGLRPHLGDVMSSKRNAVLLWTVTPSAEQQQLVLGCLRT
jgi:hypothetical protein